MATKEIKTNLEQILEKSVTKEKEKKDTAIFNEIDFDFENLYEELNKIIKSYKSETLNKVIKSEKELSKCILTT